MDTAVAIHSVYSVAARGTTVVERYNVKVVRSTTYSLKYYNIHAGRTFKCMMSHNHTTTKLLTLCVICATTLNQV